jgi:hypothetical protein
MTIKYRISLLFVFVFILSCVSALRYPVHPDINKLGGAELKNHLIAFLPPDSTDGVNKKTARMVLTSILKRSFSEYKIISPEECVKLIREKNLFESLKKAYSFYGEEEDNILYASAIGIDLKARYTVLSRISNVVYYGNRIYDTEYVSRFNREYSATEVISTLTTKFYRNTLVNGFFTVIDNKTRKVIWHVSDYKMGIEKAKGFKSVPVDDAMLQAYGASYMNIAPKTSGFPSSSRVIYLFYKRLLSKLF